MIIDISKYQGAVDWDALAPSLDFIVIKASGKVKDPQFDRNAHEATRRGIPWHVYHFLYCTTEARARKEAQLFSDSVGDHRPLFWVLDCEGEWGVSKKKARAVAEAFEAELRRLRGDDIRVAVYIGHNVYKDYALDYGRYAYVWIPRYGVNDGRPHTPPDYPCDLWQYSSTGRAPGISGNVDVNTLAGAKPMSFFTDGTNTTDEAKEREDTMAVILGSARIDENGRATGGKAGDQTGKEVSTQSWYKHSKGWRVFRAKDPAVAEKIAQDMQWACDNSHIGYDQGQRLTLYDVSKPLGFNCHSVRTNCETDCSALVRVCCAYAGVTLPNFRTTTEPAALLDSGAFTELKGSKYTDSDKYLRRGDILVTRTQGHTVVVLSNGSKAGADDEGTAEQPGAAAPAPPSAEQGTGMAGDLSRGDHGSAVTALQRALLVWNPECLPRYGADGDFGGETEQAVKEFQRVSGLAVTGVYDEATRKALTGIGRPKSVIITGGSVNVRSAPGIDGEVLGVVHENETLPYQGETRMVGDRAWYLVIYYNQNGWVSSKYSEIGDDGDE